MTVICFIKQKTAYELRISDWSSDVCSSDLGLLRTMYDPRSSLTNDVSEQLKAHFGDKLYDTVIPRNVRLAEAPSHGMPALVYDKQSKGALAYLALARSEEHTSELQSLMRISYAVFCLKKKTK